MLFWKDVKKEALILLPNYQTTELTDRLGFHPASKMPIAAWDPEPMVVKGNLLELPCGKML